MFIKGNKKCSSDLLFNLRFKENTACVLMDLRHLEEFMNGKTMVILTVVCKKLHQIYVICHFKVFG